MDSKTSDDYSRIRRAVEKSFGRELKTPKDFEKLSDDIFKRTRSTLGTSTLKRIWGYIDQVEVRRSTLDILAKYCGFADYEAWMADLAARDISGYTDGVALRPAADLAIGDCVRLNWEPGRVCDIEYLGDDRFEVIASENTRLQPDDTFRCRLFIDGEPLYLDNLVQNRESRGSYKCGNQGGIHFSLIGD